MVTSAPCLFFVALALVTVFDILLFNFLIRSHADQHPLLRDFGWGYFGGYGDVGEESDAKVF
jgi:hypothetical protein